MRMTGKVILITGGGTGIGFALARLLAGRGNEVVICGRRRQAVEAAVARVTGLRGIACDIAHDGGIGQLLEYTRTSCGRLDVLINNAGVQVQTNILESSWSSDEIDDEIRTNLLGPMKLSIAALPLLLARPTGLIVNICSLLALMPKANAPGYCASKAGLLGFSEALRLGLQGSSVRVATVFPPLVATPMTEGRGANKMSAEDFAKAALTQLETGRSEIRVGQAATILALHQLSPSIASWWTRRISRGTTRPQKSIRP